MTIVPTYGVMPGLHSGIVQSEVVMDDLFRINLLGILKA